MITDDEAGFDEFVAGRSAALARTAYLLTSDHHLAQDLLQTALIQAARHWGESTPRPRPTSGAPSRSLAVDLIPDLDGTSSQALTHDFGQHPAGDSPWRGRLPLALGALLALLAGLAYIRMLRKQARPRPRPELPNSPGVISAELPPYLSVARRGRQRDVARWRPAKRRTHPPPT